METQSVVENRRTNHKFEINFYVRPKLCFYCNDYIWGTSYSGYRCVNCSCVHIHSQCLVYYNHWQNTTDAYCCCQADANDAGDDDECQTRPYTVDKWSDNNVREWLAVVNLHRYADLFHKTKVNGVCLLDLDKAKLKQLRIIDPYHQDCILLAIGELVKRSKITLNALLAEQEALKVNLNSLKVPVNTHSHFYLPVTFTESVKCNFCHGHLYGIFQQGLMCQTCGLCVHRQCSHLCLNKCTATGDPTRRPNHVYGMQLFGANLFDFGADVPLLLTKSCEYLERRAIESNLDLYDIYRLSSDTAKQNQFKQQLNETGIELTNYDLVDLNTIASIVKAFLRELQNSLVPEEDYARFMDYARRVQTHDPCNHMFRMLVESLHPIHFKCLKYVCLHLIRVWNHQHNNKNCMYFPDKLIHIFRGIMLRPKWTNIIDCVHDLDLQSLIVKHLLLDYTWDSAVQIPLYKDRPVKPQQPSTGSESSRMESYGNHIRPIDDEQWYWPDITRHDTLTLLKNASDGTYLIRNAGSHTTINAQQSQQNTPTDEYYIDLCNVNASNRACAGAEMITTPYILCLTKDSSIKSIKIFQNRLDNLVDIELPCRFKSIQMLVDYYTNNEISDELRIRLVKPLSKYQYGYTSDWDIGKLYKSYYETFQHLDVKVKKTEGISNEICLLREDFGNKSNAHEAYQKIVSMYSAQIRILLQSRCNRETDNAQLFISEQINVLERKISDLEAKRNDLRSDCDYITTIITTLMDEVEQLKPDLVELKKKRENYYMWLIQRGENDENILSALKAPAINMDETQMSTSDNGDNSQTTTDSSSWYSATCSRMEAEQVLKGRTNGTFLVRAGAKTKYVLSLICDDQIKHCLIDVDQHDCHCFLKSTAIQNADQASRKFSSLADLISFYRNNSLKNYNPTMDTCLLYPAFANNRPY